MNGAPDPFAAARAIADAVLYEGYLLYPYTASARKNRIRWQFGVVVPQPYEAAGTGEHAEQQTEVLLEAGDEPRVDVLARFLRIETRAVEAAVDGTFVPVPSLVVDGTQHVTFEEGVACDVPCSVFPRGASELSVPIAFDAVRETEPLRDAGGTLVGRVVRERAPLMGTLAVRCDQVGATPGLFRVRVRIENRSDVVAAFERSSVLRTAFVSTHALLAAHDGRFLSPLDPPVAAAPLAQTLENRYVWPALVGDASLDAQRAAVVLASPIVVGDFPQIAPQTDTDAFDGTEIDELLTLSVYALSDAERAEARATDPRARALVDRAERFDDEAFGRLHAGTFVQTEAERSAPAYVIVKGTRVAKGSSVRLTPKRNADAWDMFLAGKVATVCGIQQDFEDRTYVTVTIDDDPASEYHEWYGRSFFFDTDEVEPLAAAP